ncbi:MAG: 2-C-methyl-D-erythritol 4-phosphate cytidylyltransferase [Oscillospiraceae bacterium]|jgi:2-C-methyl-D-erythritol 4-phosphate cytidylyltransferase|nr:2-C-methyl-D-erythritol 4-phosphate cytidylyltransferase [Oscillospiraceae bacterium]
MTCSAVIVAAGSARRMQGIDKVLAPIGGEPMILRTVKAVAESDLVEEIVLVTRAELVQTLGELCAEIGKPLRVVAGGESRTQSVLCGLAAVSADAALVAIHDGARPLVSVQVMDAAVQAAEKCGAAAPAIAVHDTIKVAKDGVVTCTPERKTLFAVQTPQVFDTKRIRAALEKARDLELTDDCAAAEQAGMQVRLTQGSEENLKVTTPIDITIAEAILRRREEA